ncbi:gas vesicle protein GvpG [Nesterenkonia sp. Act20]|uniref:gas vesicle protein GvpG n=1 Tax=Nesterenkonia sp. Act20 TaxID=1483432 RepID=UPI001C43A244|nr:gas vesicle protein GvpG [Nesterenkonia sp. Act20]
MGLFSSILGAPLAPLKGTVWVAEQIYQEAERQYYDPGTIRRKLREVEDARRAGTLTEERAAQLEQELVTRLLESTRRNKR